MPDRFSVVDSHVLRGGAPSAEELKILKDVWGVTKVVSLDRTIGDDIDSICNKLGLNHVIIPLEGGDDPNSTKLPDEVKQWPSEDGYVYVHCKHGKDRTGMACAIYRVLVNGWPLEKALAEAFKFGMGIGIDWEPPEAYYEAVRRAVSDDKNNIEMPIINVDVAGLSRDSDKTPKPGVKSFLPESALGDAEVLLSSQQSFAPYLDVHQDYLNRPACLRRLELHRLANQTFKGLVVYKYCPPSQAIDGNELWSVSEADARKNASGDLKDAKMFAAQIASEAKVIEYPYDPAYTYVQAAMLKDADAALFKPLNSPEQLYVINSNVIIDLKTIDGDVNNSDSVQVGLYDNYDGLASFVFPGSGGVMPADGGFAGMVQLPFTSQV